MSRQARSTGGWLLAAGAAAFLAGGQAAADPAPRAPLWRFVLRAEAEARYDDNVSGLSESEKDLLEDASASERDERFRLESAGDVILNPTLGLTFSREPRGGRETTISLSAQANEYVRNGVKDWQQLSVSARQELSRSRRHRTAVTIGGSHQPTHFLRQLTDEDESSPFDACRTGIGTCVRNPAEYSMSRGYVEIFQEIVDRFLTASAGYARERRDYGDHFDERDSSSDVGSLTVSLYPAGNNSFRIRPSYEHERRGSRGDLTGSTTVIDDSVGFDAGIYGLELRWLWGRDQDHRHNLRVFYVNERRDFTSDDPNDTGHFGREDDIVRLGAGFSKEMGPRWSWSLSLYRRTNDISTSSSEFRRQVAAVSVTYGAAKELGAPARTPEED